MCIKYIILYIWWFHLFVFYLFIYLEISRFYLPLNKITGTALTVKYDEYGFDPRENILTNIYINIYIICNILTNLHTIVSQKILIKRKSGNFRYNVANMETSAVLRKKSETFDSLDIPII